MKGTGAAVPFRIEEAYENAFLTGGLGSKGVYLCSCSKTYNKTIFVFLKGFLLFYIFLFLRFI